MDKKRTPCFLIDLNKEGDSKVKISPVGLVTGVDGRVYNIDANKVLEKMQGQSVDIVLNVNHGMEEHGEKAAGWFDINSLEARDDGIYATLSPTDIGEELIGKKHFRYLSPEYHISWNGDIREVHDIAGVGLVNSPNVLDEALNKAEDHKNDTDPDTEDKTEDNVEQTQKEKELQEQLQAEKEKNKKLAQEAKLQRIEHAIAAGELMPNKKEFALGLDAEMLDNFLEMNKDDAKHLQDSLKPDAKKNESQISDEEREINRQLGLSDEEGDA